MLELILTRSLSLPFIADPALQTMILYNCHLLFLTDPPRVFPIPSSGYLEVDLGDEVQIGCMATGVPPPVVTWRTKVRNAFYSYQSSILI